MKYYKKDGRYLATIGTVEDMQEIEEREYNTHIAEVERQQAEAPELQPTPEQRISELEAQNQMLTECLIEMSQIVYA